MPNQNDGIPKDGRAPDGRTTFVEACVRQVSELPRNETAAPGLSALRTLQGQTAQAPRRKDFKFLSLSLRTKTP